MLDFILESKLEENLSQQIESYSPFPESTVGQWTNSDAMLPMELLAKGTLNNKINLLTGEFKPKKESNKQLEKWRIPAVLTAVLFVFLMFNLYLKNMQVEKQTLLVKQQVEAVYKQAFPLQDKLKYARIKKKLKSMLLGLDGGVAESGFLSMLNELLPAFVNNPELEATSLKFDRKKLEMRILVSGNNFQSFEKFTDSIPKHFSVEQGALNSSKDRVSGLLTIRKR